MDTASITVDATAPTVDARVQPVPRPGSVACGAGGPTNALTRVDIEGSFFLVWAPPSSSPLPLVIALHGDGNTPKQIADIWEPIWRERHDFIVAFPQAPNAFSWRTGGEDDIVKRDVPLLAATVARISRDYPVDASRIYAVGYSGGSTYLGWTGFAAMFGQPDLFAAYALHCGGYSLNYEEGACKTPARFVFGQGDPLRSGGQMIYDALKTKGHDVTWVEAGCSGHCCGDLKALSQSSLEWLFAKTKCEAKAGVCRFP